MGYVPDTPNGAQIRVLEADPDLAAELDSENARMATERARARVVDVSEDALNDSAMSWGAEVPVGLLLVEGIVLRTLTVGDRSSTELVGAGDLLRPWQRDDDHRMIPCRADWRVLEHTRAAVLDRGFAMAVAPWPQVWSALIERALRRSRWQAVSMTLSHLNRVDHRLLLMLWHCAERWGRVRPDGVVVRLPVTHETLGALVGARRPSVTGGLSQLAKDGLVLPGERGEWILTGEPPRTAYASAATPSRAPSPDVKKLQTSTTLPSGSSM